MGVHVPYWVEKFSDCVLGLWEWFYNGNTDSFYCGSHPLLTLCIHMQICPHAFQKDACRHGVMHTCSALTGVLIGRIAFVIKCA